MTFNFLAPKFMYLKSEMTELDRGLDIEVPTGQELAWMGAQSGYTCVHCGCGVENSELQTYSHTVPF